MPFLSIDPFDNPGDWTAFDPAVAPSIEISLVADTQSHPQAPQSDSLRLDLTSAATGHFIRRTLAPLDLTEFTSLSLWYRSSVAQAGNSDDPLRLRVRLGSAALAIGAPGNEWHRYLIARTAEYWSYVRMDLGDLSPQVRAAVSTIEIDVVDVDIGQSVWLDGLEARTPATVSDIDTALVARLDSVLVLGGTPVPAVIAPDAPAQPAQPFIRLVQYESSHSLRRATQISLQSDATDSGVGIRPSPVPWDVFYRAEFVATDRADQSAMVDFVMTRLGHRSWLPIGNQALRLEQVPTVLPDDALLDMPIIRYRVAAWSEVGVPTQTQQVTDTNLTIDNLAGGAA